VFQAAILELIEQEIGADYELRYRLGRGRNSSVWEATSSDGGLVAIKFQVCPDGLTTSTLLWSLQALRQLAHPHLVHIEEILGDGGAIALVMELADATLRDVLQQSLTRRKRPLSAGQVHHYLTHAAEAIDFLNGRLLNGDGQRTAIQHGAIRPSNLLLFGDAVKLADCGPVWPTNVPLRLQQRGSGLDYAAPEVFRGRFSDWTDQYALAVCWCQLRGGRLPFSDTPDTLQRSYLRPEPDLAMLPETERPLLRRALAPLPQDRWPSCSALMEHLGHVVV
jgi:serine/threonine protein kinase